jgi:hypothetical protein
MMRALLFGVIILMVPGHALAQDEEDAQETGVIVNEPGAFDGYTLFSPLDTAVTYLIDNEGRLVHAWHMEHKTFAAYLLDNGNLLRPKSYGNDGNGHFHGGGAGEGVQEVTWDGEVVWEFVYSSEEHLMHHDVEPLPNGNVLIIAWERKSVEEAIAAGRDADTLDEDGVWPLHILEIEPTRPRGGRVVWEWHVWDHMIQDHDESKAHYGDVAAHPERVDVNPPGHWMDNITEEERERLVALGYLGGGDADDDKEKRGRGADWLHTNAIAYNAELDQIALSVLGVNEIWIIDHSTTTEEARGSTGGRYGKGGDLLYRWGNPFIYRALPESEQALFAQHDVTWIPDGYPGAGNLMIYNNGRGRPDGDYSSVVVIEPPMTPDGGYTIEPGKPFGPEEPVWEYTAPNKTDFYSSFISGARRLPNGNTLICQGSDGTFFEVTQDKEVVWRYVNPVIGPEGSSHRGEDEEPTNAVFRAYRYGPDHPGLQGKDLSPGPLLEDYIKDHPPKAPATRE